MRSLGFRAGCVLILVAGALVAGCYREKRPPGPVSMSVPEEPGPPAPKPIEVQVDQTAGSKPVQFIEPFERPWPARRFTFLVTGFGAVPKSGGRVARRATALEAAVVDAIGRAAREMQRDAKTGKAPIEYELSLGEGLTVFGRLVGGSPQTAILLDRGRWHTELCACKGVLAHRPHDSAAIEEIFKAAGGKLVLHAARVSDKPGFYKADVGYYEAVEGGPATQPGKGAKKRPVIATGR